jgi:hypothetical protein
MTSHNPSLPSLPFDMKTVVTMFILAVLSMTATALALAQVPICTFDPVKGEYVCPTAATPPICTYDPAKGEYVCPTTKTREVSDDMSTAFGTTLIDAAAVKCGQEGLQKCTREREGSVCRNGEWKSVHRCNTGQQCGMKDGNFCCRTRGPGFSCSRLEQSVSRERQACKRMRAIRVLTILLTYDSHFQYLPDV